MKFNKLYTLMLASVLFVGCSDDDSAWNSDNAMVSMGETELSYKENKGIINVPIVVDGTLNGPVQVTVEVAEKGSNPAMDDIHYLVTSKTIVIAEGATSGSIELLTVDDEEINEAREFTMTIKSAIGASVGSAATTTIILKDNDSAFYEKLQGKWKMKANDFWDDSEATFDITIVGAEEGEADYDKVLYATGIYGYSWAQMQLNYSFDASTKTVTLTVPMGSTCAVDVNFGMPNLQNVYYATVSDAGSLTTDGEVVFTVNDEFTAFEAPENATILGGVFDSVSGGYNGLWFGYYGIKFTK